MRWRHSMKKVKGSSKGKGKMGVRSAFADKEKIARKVRERAIKKRKEAQGTSTLQWEGDFFDLKKKMKFAILPYKVTQKGHPDECEIGEYWYRRPYSIHYGVNTGQESKPVICPKTFGKKCPICEEVDRLWKDYNENEEAIKQLKAKHRDVFPAWDYKEKSVKMIDVSYHNFTKQLIEEIAEGERHYRTFYFPGKDGLDLECRFSQKSFGNNNFMQVSRIDFRDRTRPYPDSALDEVPELDELLKIHSYKELKQMLLDSLDEDEEYEDEDEDDMDDDDEEDTDIDDEDEEEEEEDDEDEEEEEDDEEEDDEEEDEEEEKKKKPKKPTNKKGKTSKKGGKNSAKKSKKKCPHGFDFGADCDEQEECDDCKRWESCFEASKKL